nr:unnamed protein product [Haemonchus contortus]
MEKARSRSSSDSVPDDVFFFVICVGVTGWVGRSECDQGRLIDGMCFVCCVLGAAALGRITSQRLQVESGPVASGTCWFPYICQGHVI